MLSTKEVCKRLGISRWTLLRLLRKGELPGYKVGGTWRFREVDIDAYLEHIQSPYGQTISPGRVFDFWVLTKYYHNPKKYQIIKQGSFGTLSVKKEYLAKLSEAERRREGFKPIKYRRTRLSSGASAILISPRYFARLPKPEQKEWLKARIKSPSFQEWGF